MLCYDQPGICLCTLLRSIFLCAGCNYCAAQHSPAKIQGTMQTFHAVGPIGCNHVRILILYCKPALLLPEVVCTGF